MTSAQFVLLLLTVLGIAVGQLLFKAGANAIPENARILDLFFNHYIVIGIFVYMLCTVAWILILREVPLNKAYPVFSLAFVFVPLLGWYFLNEPFTRMYMLGIVLIIAGMILATR